MSKPVVNKPLLKEAWLGSCY